MENSRSSNFKKADFHDRFQKFKNVMLIMDCKYFA